MVIHTLSLTYNYMLYLQINSLSQYCRHEILARTFLPPKFTKKGAHLQNLAFSICSARCLIRWHSRHFCRGGWKHATFNTLRFLSLCHSLLALVRQDEVIGSWGHIHMLHLCYKCFLMTLTGQVFKQFLDCLSEALNCWLRCCYLESHHPPAVECRIKYSICGSTKEDIADNRGAQEWLFWEILLSQFDKQTFCLMESPVNTSTNVKKSSKWPIDLQIN